MNPKQSPLISQKDFILCGAVFVIIGSFLPWEIAGDFISTWRYGIQIFPTFAAHGGIFVALLGMFVILFAARLDSYIQYATKNILISAISLCVISAYHIVDWLVRRITSHGIVGAPGIAIGLILVIVGSIMILATVLRLRAKESQNHA